MAEVQDAHWTAGSSPFLQVVNFMNAFRTRGHFVALLDPIRGTRNTTSCIILRVDPALTSFDPTLILPRNSPEARAKEELLAVEECG